MLPTWIELQLQSELGVDEVAETGSTFVENALIKARHASQVTGLPAIADDSGLCVNALGGRPGIYSARYAGVGASDTDNVARLLDELGDTPDRQACFYCLLVCLRDPLDPSPLIATGEWHGEIATSVSGGGGFGYDPVFFLPALGATAAQLSPDEKNARSHRGMALRQLADQIRERYSA